MAHGNKVAGKMQRSFYLSHDVVEALRTAAFERRESQSEIVEKALRKELGLMKKVEIVVIECGEGWMDRRTGWATHVADDAIDEQILGEAIAEVEAAGYDVMRDADGGACEVTHYADGRIVANITVRPLKIGRASCRRNGRVSSIAGSHSSRP